MSKRIFTKVFSGTLAATGAIPTVNDAALSWLVQEDIEVIGAQGRIYNTMPSENDGIATARVELSQVGIANQDGAILSVAASEWWNTAPAGIALTNGHQAVAFNPGEVIPVREEGYLYLNEYAFGKTAGTSSFLYEVIIYYLRRGARVRTRV